MGHTADEIRRLQGCINDLISVLALPAMWGGQESAQIVSTLLDVLIGMLRLDFAYVRLKDPSAEGHIEMVRLAQSRNPVVQPQEIGQVLNLSGALDLQRDPAIRRHRNPERRGRQQQRDRARQRDVIPLEPGDLPFDIEVSAVPTAVDREPQTLQP